MIQNIQNCLLSILSFFEAAVDGVSDFTSYISNFQTYLSNFSMSVPAVLAIFISSFFTVLIFNRILKLL